jgi:nucleoside-diphosphate-sugar epimerase
MAKQVLVTGASGLIGRELCKQLTQQEYHVTAVDNNFRFDFVPICDEYVKDNIVNYLTIIENKFDYIFHMANINGTKYFYEIPNKLIENNITADFSVFNFVKKNPNCKIIYASSSEVIADTETYPTVEEKDITIKNIHNSRWSYRLGKLVGENYLTNSDLDYLIVRFFNVFSENSGAGHFVYDIIDKLKNKDYRLIGPNETRSFCHVIDAVDAVLKIKNISGEVVNVGSDEEITILDAADIIAEAYDVKNFKWCFENKLPGSANRRKPNLNKLKKYYPDFSPKSFQNAVKELIHIKA